MRPERLEVEGFTAFRELTAIDFEGADLFALAGPTGSGKSSLIDAMTFALYGSIPRLDKKAVAPVISQGLLQARVRLDFTVGEQGYTAVRVVRATAAGATTKEARLERRDHGGGGETVAGDAKALTAAVEDLLGLSFEHFCTCVVLPQGEFAALLHAEPRKRQDMLLALLDLGLYEQMGQAARTRAVDAAAQVGVLERQLAELADASEEAVKEAERRVVVLDKLVERIDEARPRLGELTSTIAAAKVEADEAAGRVKALTGMAVPAEARALAEKAKQGRDELRELVAAHEAAVGFLDTAEVAMAEAADRSQLNERLGLLTRRDEQAERIATGEAMAADTEKALAEATARREEADAAFARAQVAVVAARDANRAETLARELVAGTACPVCGQQVQELPHRDAAPDLDVVEADQEAASKAMTSAHDAERDAQRAHDKVTTTLTEVREAVTRLGEQLGAGPTREEIVAAVAALDRREKDLRSARETEKQRRRDRDAAEARARSLAEEESGLWIRFQEARDALAPMGPPPAERDDLGAAWAALVAWAEEARPAQEEKAAEARVTVDDAETERADIEARIRETCAELEVVVGERDPRDATIEARETARTRSEALARDRQRATGLEAQRQGLDERRTVAEELGRHLRADHFEKWILDEALHRLVEGATEILMGLSGGAYSLALDRSGANFAVVDHANADAVRGAKTLSGGETFLASLALALALADQVADLAAGGSARLESIFCDEGFGSLDLDTLDVVATALEELGASGRMVGVVSHVRELAERLPVRFEVRKGPTSSTVTRVDA